MLNPNPTRFLNCSRLQGGSLRHLYLYCKKHLFPIPTRWVITTLIFILQKTSFSYPYKVGHYDTYIYIAKNIFFLSLQGGSLRHLYLYCKKHLFPIPTRWVITTLIFILQKTSFSYPYKVGQNDLLQCISWCKLNKWKFLRYL